MMRARNRYQAVILTGMTLQGYHLAERPMAVVIHDFVFSSLRQHLLPDQYPFVHPVVGGAA
ncbi:hypothetical protein [Sodalis sp.]|uniref:hypothetical protein n=1 Tax=Sodalis sp. (in: enterobacteria) TaxID=1898979 RepID=UPI00387357D2